jgi:hypothetical protein
VPNHIPPNQFPTATAFFGTKYRRTDIPSPHCRAVPILAKYFKVFRACSSTVHTMHVREPVMHSQQHFTLMLRAFFSQLIERGED